MWWRSVVVGAVAGAVFALLVAAWSGYLERGSDDLAWLWVVVAAYGLPIGVVAGPVLALAARGLRVLGAPRVAVSVGLAVGLHVALAGWEVPTVFTLGLAVLMAATCQVALVAVERSNVRDP